ncbi:hypothetical protein ACP26L_17765 [Paenibacillus sp. S-38]|uniref:hypothetical protein n=1 Tax=Paenibacillus sp. S-38 TaxID=3416710 RepID=UPI003CFB24CB
MSTFKDASLGLAAAMCGSTLSPTDALTSMKQGAKPRWSAPFYGLIIIDLAFQILEYCCRQKMEEHGMLDYKSLWFHNL